MSELLTKKCVPCKGGIPPLGDADVQKYLKEIPEWDVHTEEEVPRIDREFTFKDFKEAIAFVNKVADIAEAEGHHPNILIHSWNKVRIELYTHAIGGLHENDFIIAAKINEL